jgi:antitoxin (DNA-binding transcriptional repressor) of toxin-antitoxin stability system
MRIVSISVTEASRNFADCVNRARYQGTIFFLHKNGIPVARITPIERTVNLGSEFEGAREEASASERQPAERQRDPTPTHPVRVQEIW